MAFCTANFSDEADDCSAAVAADWIDAIEAVVVVGFVVEDVLFIADVLDVDAVVAVAPLALVDTAVAAALVVAGVGVADVGVVELTGDELDTAFEPAEEFEAELEFEAAGVDTTGTNVTGVGEAVDDCVGATAGEELDEFDTEAAWLPVLDEFDSDVEFGVGVVVVTVTSLVAAFTEICTVVDEFDDPTMLDKSSAPDDDGVSELSAAWALAAF